MSRDNITTIIESNSKIDVNQLRKTREILRKIRARKMPQEQAFDMLGRSSHPLVPADDDSVSPVRKKQRE